MDEQTPDSVGGDELAALIAAGGIWGLAPKWVPREYAVPTGEVKRRVQTGLRRLAMQIREEDTEAPYSPAMGEVVWDSDRDRVGTVMGHEGPCYQLRPLKGGVEWDARNIAPMSQTEVLSARVAVANARTREP
ncbi:hypothetical protein ACWGJW_02605 [Streptomyces nigrescens]